MHTPSGQPTLQRPGSSWGSGALLKGLTSVVNNSCRIRDSNPQPKITSTTLYPLEPRLPPTVDERVLCTSLQCTSRGQSHHMIVCCKLILFTNVFVLLCKMYFKILIMWNVFLLFILLFLYNIQSFFLFVQGHIMAVHRNFHNIIFSTIKDNVDQQLFGYPHSSNYLLLCPALEIN